MDAEAGGGGDSLIPDLPEDVVRVHVVSRLPWYSRPVCRSISKHWRAFIDTFMQEPDLLAVETRKHQLPLLTGLFVICTSRDAQLFLSRDQAHQLETYHTVEEGDIYRQYWRKLPPLQHFVRGPCRRYDILLLANYGMVYVWLSQGPNVVWKLDLGRGDWNWRMHRVPRPFDDNAIFKGKIIVPLDDAVIPLDDAAGLQTERQKKKGLLVYDMMSDLCKGMARGNFPDLRVLLKTSSQSASHVEEELYGLVEFESKLRVVVCDTCRNSWRIKAEIPIPEWKWWDEWEWWDEWKLSIVHLLNRNCFEPATETDINIVWWDEQYDFYWFNPSMHRNWVQLRCDYRVLAFEYPLFIRGSLYGVFLEFYDEELKNEDRQEELMRIKLCKSTSMSQGICNDEEDQHDKEEDNKDTEMKEVCASQQDEIFRGRAIVKGTICVAERRIRWEKVLDIGVFMDVVRPVNDCALIA